MGGTEQLTLCSDRASGLQAAIAIDDTTLGPGLGGVRWLPCSDEWAAAERACRLARVMTMKHACADLPYGGAKAVVVRDSRADTDEDRRHAQLLAFGRFVDRLGGAYIPGVDMGTSVEDLAVIGGIAHDVTCDRQDPSPWTALGVFVGIAAALVAAGVDLAGAHVVVQGAGHVGADLARRLARAGCRVSVADVDPDRACTVAAEIGGRVVDPTRAVTTPCDVLAPCATGPVIDRAIIDALHCRIVAGGANDVLATRAVAPRLAERHISYVPDFVINAGGVIHIHAVRVGWGPEKLQESVVAIADRVAWIISEADRTGRTPVVVAEDMASHRLGRPVTLPS
jgi:leucine dehydrogenase